MLTRFISGSHEKTAGTESCSSAALRGLETITEDHFSPQEEQKCFTAIKDIYLKSVQAGVSRYGS